MAEFHFLRPLWLLLLPVAIWAAWRFGTGRGGSSGWRAVVDAALQPHVLSEGESVTQRRWPLLVALSAVIVASLALAGPAWDRLPVPAYRSDESLVVALDLSRSMDATDVEPTRLTRAKLKLLDLLERRAGGQTALVVFSSNAFTVTPLTSDTKTISSLINALGTDIMPSRGSLIEVGIRKAADLLSQTGVSRGEILLITDATASPDAFALAESLRDSDVVTSVLAVGTEDGAPIPAFDGGFVTGAGGQVVVPQLNADNLQRLALAGGGRFARLGAGDADLDRLFPDDTAGAVVADDDGENEADIWRDQGVWLCILLLPLVALGFRRGWVYVIVAGLALEPPEAQAFEWSDLWLKPDQQGLRAMEREAPGEAAALFEDPEWLAAARYRAGEFESSASVLGGIDTPDAHYNRGNALARAGRLAEAIEAYDRALELEPAHEDAEFNRELVAELLEQQPPPEDESNPNDQDQQQSDSDQSDSDSGSEGQQSPQNSDGQNSDEPQSSDDQQSGGNSDSEEQAADAESEQGPPEESGDEGEPQPQQASAEPQDIEDWASEQAAEQWLRRIPQDPGGLLRRKFLYQYQQLGVDQDGNRIDPGSEDEPW